MRIENPDARSFYEIECTQQQWSVRQLSRQVGSSLYERLALSRNKDEVMKLAKEGQTIEKPSDVIKDPLTLEFLGLKPDESSHGYLSHSSRYTQVPVPVTTAGFLPNFTSRRCAITLIAIIQMFFRLEMLINLLVLSLSPLSAAPGPH